MTTGRPDIPDAVREAGNALVAVLADARERRRFDDPAVREAVRHCAVAARASGMRPERLVPFIRGLVADEALSEVNAWFRGVVTDRLIVWAIDDYFAAGRDSAPPG